MSTAAHHSRPPGEILRRKLGVFDWVLTSSCRNGDWLKWLENPGQPLKLAAPGREVMRVRLDGTSEGDLVVKRFVPSGWSENLKWTWRVSPAYRAFELARHVQALGIPTAAPIAAGERRWGRLLRECFLLTAFVPDALPLTRFNASCADRRRRNRIVGDLARVYATSHEGGFYHSDPSQSNFLVAPGMDDRETVVLIDLDGLRRCSVMDLDASAQDLRRLLRRGFIPRRERAWFIIVYARSRKPPMAARKLVKLIGPLPERATSPQCALDEHSQPVAAL